jgi:hypothetical protein
MVIAAAVFKCDPADTETMLSEADDIREVTLSEEGCLRAEMALSVKSEGELFGFSVWQDLDSFEGHVAAVGNDPRYSLWNGRLTGVQGTIFDASVVEPSAD